ncbi:MAG: glycosyl hydrolase [Oscillospiraceae bacterium]|nr:glycosyl hydrolase [Oscillospiraceae bacterium]
MTKLYDLISGKEAGDNIFPLFWQHAEDEQTLRNEIQKMKSANLAGFIVEARPHPDFLGPLWWRDLDFIIDEAKKCDMKVWIFDDSVYPSGCANGYIKKNNPELVKKYIKENHIDAIGPLRGSSVIVKQWYGDDEELLAVVAAKRTDMENEIDSNTLVDITSHVKDGMLYWDVPEGAWRIFIFIATNNDGEEWTKDYLNPIQQEAVKAYIDYIYEPYYERYPEEFGKTIVGFFTDEARFGTCSTYEAILGKCPTVVPYKDGLLKILSDKWNSDFTKYLPLLWYNKDMLSANAKFVYMDTVSTLFGESFQGQIGDWCRKHNVKSIGHVVEDNGAHARLGYGAGHFFKVIRGQDYSGYDIVYQVLPEYTDGKYNSPFGVLDAEFFYWGISKMAVSESHIDPKKNGITVCEIFGAYGWQEGLKLMKWLTDHVCVRGTNVIIPHAFSPKYPDDDCPPHFYAQGYNPQWKDFSIWSNYTNRICNLIKGGNHIADVTVLYHAEAEWSGKSQPFEKIVKNLSENQIDCDVVPLGVFADKEIYECKKGKFRINKEEYSALIIPYSEFLPDVFLSEVLNLLKNGIRVIFAEDFPTAALGNIELNADVIQKIRENKQSLCCLTANISEQLKADGIGVDISIPTPNKYLRHYHYVIGDMNIYFLTNESKYQTFNEVVKFPFAENSILYDAMDNRAYNSFAEIKDGESEIKISLEPYESLFVIFGSDVKSDSVRIKSADLQDVMTVNGDWRVYKTLSENYPDFELDEKIKGLENVSDKDLYPDFSGIFRYETEFSLQNVSEGIFLDLGEAYETVSLYLNGEKVGTKICPPYLFDVTSYIKEGNNILAVEVTNTLAKAKGDNLFDRYMPQEPSGLLGPVKLKKAY